MSVDPIEREARKAIFSRVLTYIGKSLGTPFLKRTSRFLPGIERIHPLIEGIYKPAGSDLALSIRSTLGNPYNDRIEYGEDGSWIYYYSAKDGSLDSAVNASLFLGMAAKEPVIVLRQISDKHAPEKTQYRFHGLGILEHFDENNRLFRIRGMHIEEINDYLGYGMVMEDDLIETAIQLEALEEWRPFEDPNRKLYRVSAQKRNEKFRKTVLGNYESRCAITGQLFILNKLIEAEAAHIIPKERRGTDDPRNGLAMSRSVHWAFDKGIFTLTDQYEVIIHPKARGAKVQAFPLWDKEGSQIHLPKEKYYWPHPDALKWHQDKIYGKFAAKNAN